MNKNEIKSITHSITLVSLHSTGSLWKWKTYSTLHTPPHLNTQIPFALKSPPPQGSTALNKHPLGYHKLENLSDCYLDVTERDFDECLRAVLGLWVKMVKVRCHVALVLLYFTQPPDSIILSPSGMWLILLLLVSLTHVSGNIFQRKHNI